MTNEGQTETIAELKRVRAEAAERFNLPLLKPLDQILPELSPSPTGLVKDSSKLIINGGECTVLSLTQDVSSRLIITGL